MKDTQACAGCHENFYNGNNPLGVKRCWHVDRAKVQTRFRLHINTPMNQKRGYVKKRVPQCYHEPGYIYVDKIPDYAKVTP